MKYDLMHKNYNVLTMDIDEKKDLIERGDNFASFYLF